MTKLDNTTAQAMNLYAKLKGIDISTKSSDQDDGVEIEIVDNKDKKKQSKVKKKEPIAPRVITVPDLEKFNKLNRNTTIGVEQYAHDIHYKEQIWGIPKRTIEYRLELVTNKKIATDIAVMFGDKTPEALRDAENGEVRYIRIVSYENIPYRSKEIGYIKVVCDNDGKLKSKTLLKNAAMKENNINPEKVKKTLENVKDKLLGRENR